MRVRNYQSEGKPLKKMQIWLLCSDINETVLDILYPFGSIYYKKRITTRLQTPPRIIQDCEDTSWLLKLRGKETKKGNETGEESREQVL